MQPCDTPVIQGKGRVMRALRNERGAILLLSGLLSAVIVTLSIAFFMQSREHRFQSVRKRAKLHARYCAEYAVARYGVPAFMSDPDRYEGGEVSNNWIDPISQNDVLGADFLGEDAGIEFTYDFDSLKMDKVFDVTSRQPFYFVSAQGVVSWRIGREDHEVRHRAAVALTFNDFSRFMYFSNGEVSLENGTVNFRAGDELYGRVHINGHVNISSSCCPIFHGYYTQTDDAIGNYSGDLDTIFQGGYSFPFPEIEWPPADAILQIKEQRTPAHTYEGVTRIGDVDVPTTTYIKFDDRVYHVAQYLTDSVRAVTDAGGDPTGIYDTTYVTGSGVNWHTKNLPYGGGHELIYVDGVCRVEGRVDGMITVLASDTMFIMDDIYTSDTNLNPADPDNFGMIPQGSTRRIGLASEGDVYIAMTPPNGGFNGASVTNNLCTNVMGPSYTGGPARGDNTDITVNNHGHMNVIITAAIFAVKCSFGTEFWHSCALTHPFPNTEGVPNGGTPRLPDLCAGEAGRNNSHIARWNCYGANNDQDERGEIFLCGSIVQTTRGFTIRNPPGPFDPCSIGYTNRYYRYDNNFLNGGPPVWFRVRYSDGSQDVSTQLVLSDYDHWRELRTTNQVEVTE